MTWRTPHILPSDSSSKRYSDRYGVGFGVCLTHRSCPVPVPSRCLFFVRRSFLLTSLLEELLVAGARASNQEASA